MEQQAIFVSRNNPKLYYGQTGTLVKDDSVNLGTFIPHDKDTDYQYRVNLDHVVTVDDMLYYDRYHM